MPDPHFIYMSKHHREGLAHLLYGIKQGGGFIALTGEVGTGKTMLCKCLLDQLPDNVDIALVLNPKLSAIELLATICDELHISYNPDRLTLKDLIDNLNKYLLDAHAEGRQTVVMIDEAQNLSLDVLEQIRLLTNLETSKTKLLQIILVAQPELKQLLELPELRQLNQRITARYHLTPLSYTDTYKYIYHRLAMCGGKTNIFSHNAIRKIYKISNGIPRLINILCDRALLGAYVLDTHFVSKKIVSNAAKEVLNTLPKSAFITLPSIAIFCAICILISLLFFLTAKPKKTQLILSGTFSEISTQEESSKARSKPTHFIPYIKQNNISLDTAISRLSSLWNKTIPVNAGCKELESYTLHCFFEKSNWKSMVALNRPVIMEFSSSDTEKSYLLLVGIKNGNPVFNMTTKTIFPLEQILQSWDGYYMTLWQPPVNGVTKIYPKQASEAVIWVRKQISSNWNDSLMTSRSAYFNNKLKTKVINFQKHHNLTRDGIVGPKTFIHLQNKLALNQSPQLKMND